MEEIRSPVNVMQVLNLHNSRCKVQETSRIISLRNIITLILPAWIW